MRMPSIRILRASGPRRGTALLFALVIAVAMAGMCMALLSVNLSTGRARVAGRLGQRSFYAAEAGLSDAFVQVNTGQISAQPGMPAWLGSPDEPVPLGTSSYWVEVDRISSRSYSLASTGFDGNDRTRLELVLSEVPTGFFQFAAFGDRGVVLDSNSFIDSYDSTLGSYDSQVKGGNDFARENGHVGSNSDILLKSNTEVHGDCRPGPGHVVNDSAPGTYVSGSMDPLEEVFEFPPIEIPAVPSKGNLVGSGSVVLGPGDVHYSSILMKGGSTLTLMGPARIIADDFLMKSNTELIFDTSAGKIELYSARNFVLESNSKTTTLSDSAVDVTLMLNGNNISKKPADSVQLGSNADFIGAIYAPNADFKLSSNFNIYGSIMCGRLHLSSFGQIHFDEALLYDGWGSTDELEPRFWRRMPLP